jgi:hypothetical protein
MKHSTTPIQITKLELDPITAWVSFTDKLNQMITRAQDGNKIVFDEDAKELKELFLKMENTPYAGTAVQTFNGFLADMGIPRHAEEILDVQRPQIATPERSYPDELAQVVDSTRTRAQGANWVLQR